MNNDSLEFLAMVVAAARYRGPKHAKRVMHEHGITPANSAALADLMKRIQAHPESGKIHDLAESIQAARMTRQRADVDRPDARPSWLICERPDWSGTYILHLDPGGSFSFLGQVFDRLGAAPHGQTAADLDGGQVLSNIVWLNCEPPVELRRALMLEARRQLRIYDAER